MREIKFRAWNFNTKSWHDFKSADDIFGTHHGSRTVRFNRGDIVACQFTGLLDKNGKEIFEGDILKDDVGVIGDDISNNPYITLVRWETYGWTTLKPGEPDTAFAGKAPFFDWSECEVIGNIYENKELL